MDSTTNNAETSDDKSNVARRNRLLTLLGAVLMIFLIVGISVGMGKKNNNDSDESDTAARSVPNNNSDAVSPTQPPTNLRGPPSDVFFYENNEDQLSAFLIDPEFVDREFYMVNIIRYRDKAVYKDGRETNLTGFEANKVYADHVLPELQRIGAEIVISADIESEFGQDTPYTDLAIIRYPNTTAFQGMINNPTFQEELAHKEAGLELNFVMACEMLDMPYLPPLENPPFPANETNPVTSMMNIIDYREKALYQEGDADADNNRTGREAYSMYSDNASPIVGSYGVRNLARFNVKAVVIGQIGYEEIRFNWFPSDETFRNVIANPERQSYRHHRYAGMEEISKSFKVMPITINKLFPKDDEAVVVDADTCDLCGNGGVISNPSGFATLPDGQIIECSDLAAAVNNGLIPLDQCALIAPYVPVACNCTIGESPTTDDPIDACTVCEGSFANTDAVVALPTGESIPCGQLEFAVSSGMIPTEACSIVVDLARETCGCVGDE